MKLIRGFTLIELLVTIAVMIILATIAVPNFQNMMVRSQWASEYNEILAGLNLSRSEAVKRREDVSLEFTSGGTSWSYEVQDSDGNTLRIRESSNERVSLDKSDNFEIIFNSLGRMEGGSCSGGCEIEVASGSNCSVIDINSLGRVSRADCDGDG
ncbi:MAG: GspH/FimT family pseudopilin [Pseudomonadota bacterium]